MREDEIAAKAMGINVASQKTLAFVLGSLFAGIAGALYAHINGFLHPNTFNFIKSFDPMIIIVFGGLGSLTGTVFGAFAWALILEGVLRVVLPQGFETWRFVVYPLLLIDHDVAAAGGHLRQVRSSVPETGAATATKIGG